MNNPHDTLVLFGGAVKAKGEGKVGGYLVLFGDKKSKDLSGEFFTADTDYDTEFPGKSSVYYHHALDASLGVRKLTETKAETGVDEVGVWIEAQLNLRDKYAAAVYKMVEEEKLGWSSGTATHLVSKKSTGEIEHWPLGLDASLTPTPCDARNLASVKSFSRPIETLALPTFDELTGVKSDGLSSGDKRRLLQRALELRLSQGGYYQYAYVNDDWIFETTFVFSMGDKTFEIPYSLDGFSATLGEPVEVARITRFEPVAPPEPPPADPVDALKAHLERLRTTPDEAAVEGLKSLRADLDALLTPPPATDLRADFEREVAAALRLFR